MDTVWILLATGAGACIALQAAANGSLRTNLADARYDAGGTVVELDRWPTRGVDRFIGSRPRRIGSVTGRRRQEIPLRRAPGSQASAVARRSRAAGESPPP